jgi:hypothetical protein
MSQQPPSPSYPPTPGAPILPGSPGPVGVLLETAKNTPATTSLVLGIVSIVSIVTSLFFVPAVLGITFGIVGLNRAGRSASPVGRGKAITGTVLSAVGLVLGISLVNAIPGGDDPTSDSTGTSVTQEADGGAEKPADDTKATEPTDKPQPVDPLVEKYGEFKAFTKSGTGKSVVVLPDGVGAAMVTAEHVGQSNFALTVLDANNQSTGDLLVNRIGNYAGTTAYGMNDDLGTSARLQVEADGEWTVTVSQLSTASELKLPHEGTGDGVFRYLGDAAQWRLTHSGSSNFAVIQYADLFPGLLANEIGQFRGTVPATAGPVIVTITADGAWSVK